MRVSNQRRTKLEDEKEEKDDDGRPASFVKPLLNSVAGQISYIYQFLLNIYIYEKL